MKIITIEIPISKPYFSNNEILALAEPIKSGQVTQGKEIEKFEKELQSVCSCTFAVAVNSGTSALQLSLLSHNIGAEDEVICPSYSFIATANSIKTTGATPVFTDVDMHTYNMTTELTESLITKKTKAIMLVHQFGSPLDLDGFKNLAKKYNLLLIQDAACAIGSLYKNHPVCTWGDTSCLSFHPRKIITTGEGGAILTNDTKINEKVRELRSHGRKIDSVKEEYNSFGFNYRMSELNAVIGNMQIKKLNEILEKRTKIANNYLIELSKYKNKFGLPKYLPDSRPNYQTFQIRILEGKLKREHLMKFLKDHGIDTRSGIPPIHKQNCYSNLSEYSNTKLSNTELLYEQGLCLPIFPSLEENEQEYILDKLIKGIEQI
ncbi:MAG: DegT/DnrJ/EryC1/StrS family aminotransferase [Candidatus Melainabacteria bacterium]|nr:DegT/DnrJ/EryC1/StrS family aminotransferase [Candidatus Melainabacteria bacterium]